MLKVENTKTYGWEAAVRGMRNPLNSWAKSDSYDRCGLLDEDDFNEAKQDGCVPELAKWSIDNPNSRSCDPFCNYVVGDNDLDLMKRLRNAGTDHRKYLRMITVYCDITAPLYWWKEFDTYKVGTVANSCSTMHKIQAKEFTLDDFSHEHLIDMPDDFLVDKSEGNIGIGWDEIDRCIMENVVSFWPINVLEITIGLLNNCREEYLTTKDKKYWWQMIQLLPSSYNQKRTVMMNYEVLANMYKSRKNHKLDEWHTLCDWIKTLPYAELITAEE